MISVVMKVKGSIEMRVIVIGLWKTWSLIVKVRVMEIMQGVVKLGMKRGVHKKM